MLEQAMFNIAALYGYCLRHVDRIWNELDEQYTPNEVQAGAATVFRQAVKYVPVEYLQGDAAAAGEDVRAKVDQIIQLYKQSLAVSLDRWKKIGRYNMDAVQAGAATILIQLLQVNYPFGAGGDADEVVVSDRKSQQISVHP